jgi:hypothetical protein
MSELIARDGIVSDPWSARRGYLGRCEDLIFTSRRLGVFGGALGFAYLAIFAGHIWLRDWPVTPLGPRFIDFISFWANARFALTAAAAEAYQYAAFAAVQAPYVAVTKGDLPYFHLVYPPTLFPLVAPFGLLAYLPALAAWIVTTGALYLLAVRRVLPYGVALVWALLPVAVAKNVWLGQGGFLVAGLLGLALGLIERRPFVAGLCLGLLTCKPQLGIMFPVVLLVAGQLRVIAGACLSFALLAGSVTEFYGVAIWRAYLGAFGTSSLDNFMTDDGLDAIDQTVFGVMHWFGAGFAAKWTVHAIAAALVTGFVCVICRRRVPGSLKAAAMAIGALAVTPYMLAYDLVTLTVPAMFLIRDGLARGFLPGERLTLLGCFLAMFLMQEFPVAPVILSGMGVLVARRVLGTQPPVRPLRYVHDGDIRAHADGEPRGEQLSLRRSPPARKLIRTPGKIVSAKPIRPE